jgi:hypothetical protein
MGTGWREKSKLGLCCSLLACSTPAELATSESHSLPESPRLGVEFSGCERVLQGPVCELKAGQGLVLWMEGSFRGFELEPGSARPVGEERPVAGGYQVRVTPEPDARELGLWSGGQRRWRLALAPHRSSERLALVQAARQRNDAAAITELGAAARQQGAALEAALAQGMLARLELRQGRAEQAALLLEQSTSQLFSLGQLSEATRDVFARLFILLQRSNAVVEAKDWLDRWREPVGRYPLGRALLADHDGMLLATLGEPVAALHAYRAAERGYERLGEAAHARRVRQEQVGLLSDIGETETAQALAASLMPPLAEEPDCTRAQLYILQAWLTLLLAEDGHTERARELPALFAAAEPWEHRCGDPEVVVTGLVNRGLWALHEADLGLARRLEAALTALPPRRTPELSAWVLELRARFALARGRHRQARALFETQSLIGKSSGRLDPELRALLGLAAVADAEGASARGDALLEEAVRTLQRAQRWGAFGSLVYGQFASRQRAARQLALRLIGRGELGAAWGVALSAYRAALAVQARGARLEAWPPAARERWDARIGEYREARQRLDRAAEDDWRLSSAELRVAEATRQNERQRLELLLQQAAAERPDAAGGDALPRPGPGEYWLLLFPFEGPRGAGVVALGTDGVQTHAAQVSNTRLEAVTPPEEHPLLAPFAAPLERAERIVVLPAGRTRALELETFVLGGRPLSSRRLAFGAALGALHGATPGNTRVASVSADPRGDLPFSRREGEWVAEVLGIPGSRRLSGPQVTGSNLLKQLESSDFFHFAGHAQLSGPAREAALLLANGDELEPWELFSLRAVPREVVLSACEAGDGSASGFGVGWGLAQAFLALGAETVVAPVRRVEDTRAYALQHGIYQAMRAGSPLREAFWSADRSARSSTASFRLFIR